MEHFIFAVVEAFCAPGGMLTPVSLMEKLVDCAVKFVDALPGVFAGMGVDHIQKHRNAHTVGCIDQFF